MPRGRARTVDGRRRLARRARRVRRGQLAVDAAGTMTEFAAELGHHRETGPRLTGGDLDADWRGAWGAGDEAVGGSTSTPDQDIVDELGDALGVAREPDAELQSSAEILDDRDRHRWTLEREVAREARAAEDEANEE